MKTLTAVSVALVLTMLFSLVVLHRLQRIEAQIEGLQEVSRQMGEKLIEGKMSAKTDSRFPGYSTPTVGWSYSRGTLKYNRGRLVPRETTHADRTD